MEKIGVIGKEEFCTGFKLAGVQRLFKAEDEDYRDKITDLMSKEEFGVIITNGEQFSELSEELKKKLKTSVSPIFVVLSEDGEDETLKNKVRESVGVDLLR